MKKVIVSVDENDNIYLPDGAMIFLAGSSALPEVKAVSETVETLVKQGITVDEIIKLRNNELI